MERLIKYLLITALIIGCEIQQKPAEVISTAEWTVSQNYENPDTVNISYVISGSLDSAQFRYTCMQSGSWWLNSTKHKQDSVYQNYQLLEDVVVDSWGTGCDSYIKVNINPFVEGETYTEYINIPLIKSLD